MTLRKTTLSLDADDVEAARELNLKLSEICRAAIAAAVRDTRRRDIPARSAALRERLEATGWMPPADSGEETDRAWTRG